MQRGCLALAVAMMAVGCAAGSVPGPLGQWSVVAHRMPGVSAMSDADATTWHGRTITYGSAEARSGDETCARAAYRERAVPTDSLLSASFGLTPGALGPRDSVPERVQWTEVTCGAAPWGSFGGRLLRTGADRAYAVWDGVWFELRRQ
ncbi:MAG: hypothetical protein H0T86_10125 [Gemmatimonadales bacterium]|nr:hypothetical protein [Gemmatimonadales bacterium]